MIYQIATHTAARKSKGRYPSIRAGVSLNCGEGVFEEDYEVDSDPAAAIRSFAPGNSISM